MRDWSTFAAWQAPSGNIYIAQYRASIAYDTNTGYYAWRINTRCMVNGIPATCSRYGSMGLAVQENTAAPLRFPWGHAPRTKENHKGEWIWQGDFHNTAPLPEFLLLTHGELSVHWTAPNKASTVHRVCSYTINKVFHTRRSLTGAASCTARSTDPLGASMPRDGPASGRTGRSTTPARQQTGSNCRR